MSFSASSHSTDDLCVIGIIPLKMCTHKQKSFTIISYSLQEKGMHERWWVFLV